MAKKITMAQKNGVSIKGVFEDFVVAQTAKGYTEKTIANYRSHFKSISRHIDLDCAFSALTKADIDNMIVSMRKSGLATNSISSYVRVFKTFMNWSRQQGYTTLTVPNYKQVETVKETYTDEELLLLLEKPKANGTFCEYRNWVIINFLLNSGCRASTVRNIQNRDVDLSSSRIVFRHTKTHKVQVVPLCSQMLRILRDYLKVRGGKDSDYLFCDEYGGMLTANALRLAIERYNHSRGVEKTSINAHFQTLVCIFDRLKFSHYTLGIVVNCDILFHKLKGQFGIGLFRLISVLLLFLDDQFKIGMLGNLSSQLFINCSCAFAGLVKTRLCADDLLVDKINDETLGNGKSTTKVVLLFLDSEGDQNARQK